jgi:hypothetical protein
MPKRWEVVPIARAAAVSTVDEDENLDRSSAAAAAAVE